MNSEKQYKHTEEKIIEAASGSNYFFNENAWKKMELLLDKKPNKHRPVFWISGLALAGLLLGGVYFFSNTIKQNKSSIANSQLPENKNAVTPQNDVNDGGENALKTQPSVKQNNFNNNYPANNTALNNYVVPANTNTSVPQNNNSKSIDANTSFNTKHKKAYFKNGSVKVKITAPDTESDAVISDKIKDKKVNEEDDVEASLPITPKANATEETSILITPKKETIKKDAVKKDSLQAKSKDVAKKETKKKRSFLAPFYFVGSVGIEASSTKLLSFNKSTFTPNYGFDIGYQINKKLSVQAGFHASAKKYIAGPNDYTVKAGTYLSTVKMIEVDANCLVYEVPVSFQYNWLNKQTINLYASAGLSSYIMKNEKYNYTYIKYNTIHYYPYEYYGNQHFLAALNLSVGVEKKLNNKLFLQAAPAVNIPFGGVGEGKVKLYSASFKLGIKYFPFKK
ncbi:MAG: outer membrane beta-barrel protein [Chitinophagaceae bacterium]|nr:outer membrane beta-barrel protein [Chitinophagaceae bacterium]